MAEEPQTIRAIAWRQTFPFLNLFRAFRVAVHPSKLLLALLALICLYVGGSLLDLTWAVQSRAVPNEIPLYDDFSSHARSGQQFADVRKPARDRVESDYARQLVEFGLEPNLLTAMTAVHQGSDLGMLKVKIVARLDQTVAAAKMARRQPSDTPDARAQSDRDYQATVREAYVTATREYQSAMQIKNIGLFESYFDYESNQLSKMVRAVQNWNWFGRESVAFNDSPLSDFSILQSLPQQQAGIVQCAVRFFTVAPMWLLTQHPLFFTLFGFLFLILWSLFGGAICRIAAVHVARDEKLSIRSALMFSGGKFLSFLFAPLIPLIIIVGVGLLVTAGSAIASVPYFGPIVVGAVFVLALVAGFVMALVLLGLVGGFNLMYPTVAVEGSDSFDAISRSFSYLYARPWRIGFYTVVSLVYGAASYLFVHFFIFVMLVLAHKFGGLLVFATAPSGAPLWTSLWPDPATSGRLSYEIDPLSLSFPQEIGARLIWLWVHLVIAILGAFAVCFYFSANTIIYYLMRKEVDATDLDDVYLEQIDDEFADPVTPESPSGNAVVAPEEPPAAVAPTETAIQPSA